MKNPIEGPQDQESENNKNFRLSRRGFIVGALAAGVAKVFPNISDEEVAQTEIIPKPYEIPVDRLSRDEVIREIVHDKARIIRLEVIRTYGFPQGG